MRNEKNLSTGINECMTSSKGMYPLIDPTAPNIQQTLKNSLTDFIKQWPTINKPNDLKNLYKNDKVVETQIDIIHDNMQNLISYVDCDLGGDEYFKKLDIKENDISLIRSVVPSLSKVIWEN